VRRYLAYLTYVLRHCRFVRQEARKLGVSRWRAWVHDWTKFLPSEWGPYARCFYAPNGTTQYRETPSFAHAWNLHQKRNKHHWQYWLLTWDRGETTALAMPEVYIREMVADWRGAGRVNTGSDNTQEWYEKNRTRMILHPDTRARVEDLLGEGAR